MSEAVIEVENLSKLYYLGELHKQTNSFRDKLRQGFRSVFNYSDDRIERTDKYSNLIPSNTDHIWALKDISFEVKQGEVLGIIGRNGAGKSTLLKIVSRITKPTKGRATVKGRISSLLEVGTGFHPELTGKENIYLNGAILGMRKSEIKKKFDEIIAFAEIERFLNTPVKRYSSGMYVRLAFAVAAHLEPEILLVDEVLAVGDASFQKKCLGKMGDVAQKGRTILFVSHNLAAIEHLCSRAILLTEGRKDFDDKPSNIINKYLHSAYKYSSQSELSYSVNRNLFDITSHQDFRITDIRLFSASGDPLNTFRTGDPFTIRIYYNTKHQFASQAFVVHINDQFGKRILQLNTTPISGYHVKKLDKNGYIDLNIESLPLTAGNYYLDIGFVRERKEWIVKLEHVVKLEVGLKDIYGSGMALDDSKGIIVVPHYWSQGSD